MTPELRIAAAALSEIARVRRHGGRDPEMEELGAALAGVVEDELRRAEIASELAGEIRVRRQCAALFRVMLADRGSE